MKAVDLYLQSIVPEDIYDPTLVLDKQGYATLASRLAKQHPGRYSEVMKKLSDLGRKNAYFSGETITLEDLKSPVDKVKLFSDLSTELTQARKASTSAKDYKDRRAVIWDNYLVRIDADTSANALAVGNNFGRSVVSGARGNAVQLRGMLTTPGLYTDYKGRIIPLFSQRSFAEGLRPAHYLASSYGVRASILSTKRATAKGGDLSKQLAQTASNQVVTEDDCGTSNGLDFQADDKDLIGRTLTRPTAGYPTGTTIDKEVMQQLKKAGRVVLARSPLTCASSQGLCAHCLGLRMDGTMAPIGFHAGLTASTAVSEPITQGSLNCLAAGTLVMMADGTHRAIETLDPGDQVMGSDFKGELAATTVVRKFDQGLQPVRQYWMKPPGQAPPVYARCTEEHKFLVKKFNQPTQVIPMLAPIQVVVQLLGVRPLPGRLQFMAGPEVGYEFQHTRFLGNLPCWDIEVDNQDHLFQLANGMICSNSKHTAGAAKGGKRQFSGFEIINALAQSPETFPDKATISTQAGTVESLEKAPQGGTFITIAGKQHYAMPGYAASVQIGDLVEAGDQLSEGVLDVGDVVDHRGLGEGRRHYVDRMQQAISDSGLGKPAKINLEVLARASLDHVRVEDPDGWQDALPDDLVSYNQMLKRYSPPADAVAQELGLVKGMYLHEPALHYSVGTQLTPKMTARLKTAGFSKVLASPTPPPFKSEMVRLRTASHAGKDWLAKLNTSYLGTNLQHDAERANSTNIEHNVNYAPRLAVGKGFGVNVGEKGEF